MNAKAKNEFRKLLSRYADGELDELGLKRLTQLLTEDPSAKEQYVEFLSTHSDLVLLLSSVSDEEETEQQTKTLGQEDNSKNSRRANLPTKFLGYMFVGIAASFLTFLLAFQKEPLQTEEETSYSARVIRKVDCDWEGGSWSLGETDITAGQTLSIVRGLMELEFSCGARVTLEAPSTFTIESDTHGVLAQGKLSAYVPEQARGFTVTTPQGDVVDLGTRFGLVVTEDGNSETHVFEGEVIVRRPEAKEKDEFFLTNKMALRFGSEPDDSNAIDFAPTRFTLLDFESDQTVVPPVVDRDLTLWYSAEARTQLDEEGRVVAWGDLLTESNRSEEDAWQVKPTERPLLVENAFGTLPALQFSGQQKLIVEPVALGSSMSVAVVFRLDIENYLDNWNNEGHQIFHTNVSPHIVLGVSYKYAIYSRKRTWLRTGPTGGWHYDDASYLRSENGYVTTRPIVAVMVYNPEVNQYRIYANGAIQKTKNAPKLDGVVNGFGQTRVMSTRSIGGNPLPFVENQKHLFGDIAELMVFNTGLTDEEALLLSNSLMQKYNIEELAQEDISSHAITTQIP